MKKVARNFKGDSNEGNLSKVRFVIVAANNHYAGFGPGTVNIFRQLLGLEEVKWGDEIVATNDLEKEEDVGMAKHRPKSFEFTINKIPTDLQRLSGLFSNTHVYTCGNCNHPIIFPYLTPRPPRCKKCGDDIDWSGDTEKADKRPKICPQCKTQFTPEDEFCDKCPSKVKLMWSD